MLPARQMITFWEDAHLTLRSDVLLRTTLIKKHVQTHLSLVYQCLALCLAFSALGAVGNMYWDIGGLGTFLLTLALIVYIEADQKKSEVLRRLGILCAFGFFQGATLGPLLNLATFLDSTAIVSALIVTASMFFCFSFAAMLTQRREYLYAGGFLSSLIMTFFMINLVGMLFNVEAAYSLYLFGGLIALSFFAVADTQLIIERATLGSVDVIGHACDLSIDIVGLFIRILIILLRGAFIRVFMMMTALGGSSNPLFTGRMGAESSSGPVK